MPREDPFFKKCCYFIPLSFCLQTWAIIKMLAAIAAMIMSLLIVFYVVILGGSRDPMTLMFMILLALLVITLFVDIGFNVLLMIAVCKKHTQLLKVFYYYDIYVVVAETAVFIGVILCLYPHDLSTPAIVVSICGILLIIILDICTILAVKSEMIKLRNKEQYDFVRISKYPSEIEDLSVKFTAEENLQ